MGVTDMQKAILTLVLFIYLGTLFCQPAESLDNNAAVPEFLEAQSNPDSTQTPIEKLSRQESYFAGKAYADSLVDGSGWGISGLFAGFFLNGVGAGIVYLAAMAGGQYVPEYVPPQYHVRGFRDGYIRKSYKINKKAALTGGAFGSLLQIILVLSFLEAVSSVDDESKAGETAARLNDLQPASDY
jgi:hypothetical protein